MTAPDLKLARLVLVYTDWIEVRVGSQARSRARTTANSALQCENGGRWENIPIDSTDKDDRVREIQRG